MSWFIGVLKKYAEFHGRARRKEFWFFVLFYMIFSILLTMIDGVLINAGITGGFPVLSSIYSLALFIPYLAVSARRLHDIDKSAWWLLLILIPLIGGIVLLVFWVMEGTPGENRFGDNPKTAL